MSHDASMLCFEKQEAVQPSDRKVRAHGYARVLVPVYVHTHACLCMCTHAALWLEQAVQSSDQKVCMKRASTHVDTLLCVCVCVCVQCTHSCQVHTHTRIHAYTHYTQVVSGEEGVQPGTNTQQPTHKKETGEEGRVDVVSDELARVELEKAGKENPPSTPKSKSALLLRCYRMSLKLDEVSVCV